MKWIKDRFPLVAIFALLLASYGAIAWHNKGQHNSYTGNKNRNMEQPVKDVHLPTVSGDIQGTTADNIQRQTKNNESIEPPIEDSESLQIRDHRAQISMANTAWLGLLLGLLGTLLIGMTLHYTRKAANLTQKALDATKDTSYKELRAYLGVRVDAVPVETGMESLAVRASFHNHGQTPAYNIRLIYSLYNGMPLWGPEDNPTTAILNPNESFSPNLKSKFKNAQVVHQQDTIFLNLNIVFTDMNSEERWLKCVFSKEGKKWPKKFRTVGGRLNRNGDTPLTKEVIQGTSELYLVKMETGDLKENEPYKM